MFFRIKEIRLELELTQYNISKILGITRSSYSLWELEKNIIPLNKLNKFSNTFKFSLDYITKLSSNNLYIPHDTINKKEIGKKIRLARKQNKLTQEKLAKILNTTHSAISAYENGITLIPTLFLLEICKITNKSMDWFANETEEKTKVTS